ncbi:MAG: hypothetical protein ACR2NN_01920 [Bryobacteraceae bacterium]
MGRHQDVDVVWHHDIGIELAELFRSFAVVQCIHYDLGYPAIRLSPSQRGPLVA